ncbi:unnamed protein product [Rotaria magnacalcarata]|uniref:Uncharacterized protein n=1 Tax=Rotaria magnacalcarata TaxID=392030 RepID=A0A816WCT8_9BILA|nr:unnamed protein product [Rotaria magnacalcarata]CAF4066153.1 unnamed protein product [Rotaria magnacalcarata]
MMEFQPKYQHQDSESLSIYVGPDSMSDIHNMRLRHPRPNAPSEPQALFSHLTLSTDDFPSNEHNTDLSVGSRYKHNTLQIILLMFTTLSYLLYALRAHIPSEMEKNYRFLSMIKPTSIRRVYTPDLRPNVLIENFLIRLAETFQTLWLIYILSYIPRRSHVGYVYRHPDIFNSFLCLLLLIALGFQAASQTPLNYQISCACLFASVFGLMIICRSVAVKLIRYEEKLKSIDFIINRHFILNSLFLYATTVVYLAICAAIEHFTYYLSSYFQRVTLPTTLGLSAALILLTIYFLLDQFVYEKEFYSIWTPYLFVTVIFIAPPFRDYVASEVHLITQGLNYYLLWALFITAMLMILIRLWRQTSMKYNEMKKKKKQNNLHSEQATFQAET